MIGYCPAISLVGETSVSGAISAMDCHINSAVEVGYDRLFSPGGAFSDVLFALLTIYVGLIGYGFLTGRTRLTLTMMSPRLLAMALVLTFVSVWPAYHTLFYGLFMGGPDQVAGALLGEHGSAVMNFAQGLDGLFVKFADIAKALDAGNTGPNAGTGVMLSKSTPVELFWLSGLMLLISTLGVLILTRLVLYLLLILGPVFIVFALFPQTRGLFNGWLRTSLLFALAPMLTVLGGTAALLLFVPLIDSIGDNPQAAVLAVQPMVILFVGALIYTAFLFVLMWVAASLVRDWQATWREKPATSMTSLPMQPPVSTPVSASLPGQRAGFSSSDARERTEPLVVALSRDTASGSSSGGASGGDGGRASLGLYDPQTAPVRADRFSRVQGLGQRFRSPSVTPELRPAAASKSTDIRA